LSPGAHIQTSPPPPSPLFLRSLFPAFCSSGSDSTRGSPFLKRFFLPDLQPSPFMLKDAPLPPCTQDVISYLLGTPTLVTLFFSGMDKAGLYLLVPSFALSVFSPPFHLAGFPFVEENPLLHPPPILQEPDLRRVTFFSLTDCYQQFLLPFLSSNPSFIFLAPRKVAKSILVLSRQKSLSDFSISPGKYRAFNRINEAKAFNVFFIP